MAMRPIAERFLNVLWRNGIPSKDGSKCTEEVPLIVWNPCLTLSSEDKLAASPSSLGQREESGSEGEPVAGTSSGSTSPSTSTNPPPQETAKLPATVVTTNGSLQTRESQAYLPHQLLVRANGKPPVMARSARPPLQRNKTGVATTLPPSTIAVRLTKVGKGEENYRGG